MKIFLRIIRVIFGIVLLAAFAYGLYTMAQAAPHTGDYIHNLDESEAAPLVQKPSKPSPSATASSPSGNDVSSPDDTSGEPVVEAVPEPTPLPDTPAGRAAALGLSAPPQIDISSWEYMLVNGDHSIDQYEPEQLGYLNPTVSEVDIRTAYSQARQTSAVDIRIAQALLDMCVAAKEQDGIDLVYISSGYRSYNSQLENFNRVCANNGVADGKDANGFYITMPAGCSEHQSGLCADITDKWRGVKTSAEMRDLPLSIWLAEHCDEYGFILRFPEGKESITGVMYEPWHFRYVGVDAAKYIMDNGITLEEFVGLYQ